MADHFEFDSICWDALVKRRFAAISFVCGCVREIEYVCEKGWHLLHCETMWWIRIVA